VENHICFYFPFLFYSFTVELLFPSEIRGEVTLTRLLLTAIFSLTFGPIFEELLFRGYLFKRSHEALHGSMLNFFGVKIPFAAIFSGIAFGLWHFPSPIILLYFNEPVFEIYKNLWGTVLGATIIGGFSWRNAVSYTVHSVRKYFTFLCELHVRSGNDPTIIVRVVFVAMILVVNFKF